MIRRVIIKNFKSLDVDVTLDPVTVLVGRSGTGKTNFVNALRFLRTFLAAPDTVFGSNSAMYWQAMLPTAAPPEGEMRFTVEYDIPGVLESSVYEVVFRYNKQHRQIRLVEEKLGMGNDILFHTLSNKWSTEPKVSTLPEVYPNRPVLSELNGIKKVSLAYIALTQGLGCYDFPGSVCTDSGHDTNKQNDLGDSAENYATVFDAIQKDWSRPKAWDDINAALKSLNASFETIDKSARQGGRIIVSHAFNGKVITFDINQESEGFRRFLAHLLALYQTPSKQTLVFEEPEKGIHPGALQTLAEEIKACPKDGRGQVILTTHSPNLLDHFPPESIRAVEIHEHVTKIGKLTSDQIESLKENLLRPGELLTVEDAKIEAQSREA
ncbi:MAG: ATP-binding protein [Lentisphaeria bacterium]|jgi:predicted ATPase